jgi:hypothetical protein
MKKKLTLRMDESVISKAKRLAQRRNTSVSSMLSEFITGQDELLDDLDLSPITKGMVGILAKPGTSLDEASYGAYLEEKYQ